MDDIIFFDPTQTKKMVKSQANFIATGTHCLQGDTGTNTSTTNIIWLLHEYQLFYIPEVVDIYLQNNNSTEPTIFKAYDKGYIYILSDKGTTMRWETEYTPHGSGTVLSLDNYPQTHQNFINLFNKLGIPIIMNQSNSLIRTTRSSSWLN